MTGPTGPTGTYDPFDPVQPSRPVPPVPPTPSVPPVQQFPAHGTARDDDATQVLPQASPVGAHTGEQPPIWQADEADRHPGRPPRAAAPTGGGALGALRSVGAFVALAVAALMVPLTVVGGWVHSTVSDTDAWVLKADGLLADDDVRTTVATVLANQVVGGVKGESQANQAVDGLLASDRVPPALRNRLKTSQEQVGLRLHQTLTAVITRVMETRAFKAAWSGSNRALHVQLLEHLDSPTPLTAADGTITLDLGRATRVVRKELAANGFPAVSSLPALKGEYALLPATKLEPARAAYRVLDAWAPRAPWIMVGALVVGMVLARKRLKSLARTTSAGSLLLILSLLAVVLGGRLASSNLVDSDMQNVVVVLWKSVTSPLATQVWTLVVGLAIFSVAARAVAWFAERRARHA